MKTTKLLILISFILLAFTVGDGKSEYSIPWSAISLINCDIDNDNDNDIFTGHGVNAITDWGGGAILINDGSGDFQLSDSIFFENGYTDVHFDFFDDNDYADIFSIDGILNPYTVYITIIYNYGETQFDSIMSYEIYSEPPNPFITSGDVNGDGFADLLFAHNNDFLWGVLYNDGVGNFSAPEYYNLSFPPVDITCADLNDDGRDDIVFCGTTTEIYFSTETGFQQLILTTTLSHDVLISDFDNDGDNDIITHTTFIYPNHRVYFFENLGNNQFLEHDYFQFSPFCSFAQIADFNNDSLPDMVFIAHNNSGLYVYYNIENFQMEYQQFIPIENVAAPGLTVGDFDNNLFIDVSLIISIGMPQSYLNILFNDGLGNFQDDPITSIGKKSNDRNLNFTCHPNPIKNNTSIKFSLKEKSEINLNLKDISGKPIKTIINQKTLKGGNHFYSFNANVVEKPGVYFLILTINNKQNDVIKLIKN